MSRVTNFFLRFRLFWFDDRGAVAMIYGPMAIVLLLAAGVSVDYSRAYLVKREISRALDAAVLAAGSLAVASDTERQETAQRYFDANLSASTVERYDPQLNFNFNSQTGELTASSSANVETVLMRLVNQNYVFVSTSVAAGQNLSDIEIALVLDNSGSMGGSKISSLKTAAKTLVETMYEKDNSDEFVRFALVPFTGAVNVGTANANAAWIDNAGESQAAQEDFPPDYDEYFGGISTYDNMTANQALDFFDASWKGCVRSRVGEAENDDGITVPLDVWDVVAAVDDPNTKWAKMVKPVSGNWYGGFPLYTYQVRNRLQDVNATCPNAVIAPLTNSESSIKNSIDDMNASGWTNIPSGLVWGWRVLSPGEPYTQGAEFGQTNVTKVIVVLTDGFNTVGNYNANPIYGYYSSYGMTAYNHLGTGFPGNGLDNKLADVCTNAKSQGILIYSITFQLDDENTQDLMRDCASREDMYFNSPDNASLQDAFREIAVGLQKLRLTK